MASDDKGRRSPTRVPFSCGDLAPEVGGGRAGHVAPPKGGSPRAPAPCRGGSSAGLGFAAGPQGAPHPAVSSTVARMVTMTRTSSASAVVVPGPGPARHVGLRPESTSHPHCRLPDPARGALGLTRGRVPAAEQRGGGGSPREAVGPTPRPSLPERRSPASGWSVGVFLGSGGETPRPGFHSSRKLCPCGRLPCGLGPQGGNRPPSCEASAGSAPSAHIRPRAPSPGPLAPRRPLRPERVGEENGCGDSRAPPRPSQPPPRPVLMTQTQTRPYWWGRPTHPLTDLSF